MSSFYSLLFVALTATPTPAASSPITYAQHVAPILWSNCAGCHRPGEVGPFSLLKYEDAAKRADFLASITAERRMPPWKAAEGFGEFKDEHRLTPQEIDLIGRWAAAGAPEGNPTDLPEPPKFVDGWQLGEPDLVLEMKEEFTVPADGRDIYQCFVIPIPIDENKTVAAVEFRPGNRRVVHHGILYLDSNGAARAKDDKEPGQGYRSFGGPGILPTGGLGGWAPGVTTRKLPEGVGKYLRKGCDLVMQIHYHPSGKVEQDRSRVGIYFAKTEAKLLLGGLSIVSRGLNIPPGADKHRVTAKCEPLPVDIKALAVYPHMHLLGRQMKVYAETPDGKQLPMVWVKDWDFNWQGSYVFAQPQRLPKGSVIHVEAEYDNSESNPHNPNSPPKLVTWGEETTDEMCLLTCVLVTDTMDDLRQIVKMRNGWLGAALAGGANLADIDALTKTTSSSPDDLIVSVLLEQVLNKGFKIPDVGKGQLTQYDKNGDGWMDRAEFDAAPAVVQVLIRETAKSHIREELARLKK
ncbi:MAG: ascorbate-dependent monooxygenase [Planctomycetes bacterium]|nr:ascorbate-dependent monooxygenase [Planctomycetota bacterium]